MGVSTEMEVSPMPEKDMGGFLSIDMANVEQKLAIEFDGPSHFLSDGTLNGRSKAKTRLLQQLGWRVVRIPVDEWIVKSSGPKPELNRYIRTKLDQALPPTNR